MWVIIMMNKNRIILLSICFFTTVFGKNEIESDKKVGSKTILEKPKDSSKSSEKDKTIKIEEKKSTPVAGKEVKSVQAKKDEDKKVEPKKDKAVKVEAKKSEPSTVKEIKNDNKKSEATEKKSKTKKESIDKKSVGAEKACQQENKIIESKPEPILIDRIDTVIYGPEETSIITRSDIMRVGLDGQQRTKESIIFESLVFQDSKKYTSMDEKAMDALVDKYIESIQKDQNLSLDDIKKMFHDSGYTYEEGREQLAMYNTINQIMDYKVRSGLIVPEKEVKAYYDNNPVYIEEAYKLQRIFVPIAQNGESEKIRSAARANLLDSKLIPEADYSEDFWVEKPELADDKMFISSMNVGEVSELVAVDGGYEAFKLVDKRDRQLVPLDQRYKEIADILRAPLYEKLFEEYKQSLFKDCAIADL